MYLYSFEKLEVWKLSKELCIYIYTITKNFPAEEKFGLCSQMRRASVSISSNIAEGCSRMSRPEQSHFYTIGYSSAIELLNQSIISNELQYLSLNELNMIRVKIESITKQLNSLKRAISSGSTSQPINPSTNSK